MPIYAVEITKTSVYKVLIDADSTLEAQQVGDALPDIDLPNSSSDHYSTKVVSVYVDGIVTKRRG